MTSTTPRLAESIEDLRIGQVVAWQEKNGDWHVTVRPLDEDNDPQNPENWEWTGTEVILADPPPERVQVSRGLVERLGRLVDAWIEPDRAAKDSLIGTAFQIVTDFRADEVRAAE